MRRLREYRMAWKLLCRIINASDRLDITNGTGVWLEIDTPYPVPLTEEEARFLRSFKRGGV